MTSYMRGTQDLKTHWTGLDGRNGNDERRHAMGPCLVRDSLRFNKDRPGEGTK